MNYISNYVTTFTDSFTIAEMPQRCQIVPITFRATPHDPLLLGDNVGRHFSD